jgi:hypothetical protein
VVVYTIQRFAGEIERAIGRGLVSDSPDSLFLTENHVDEIEVVRLRVLLDSFGPPVCDAVDGPLNLIETMTLGALYARYLDLVVSGPLRLTMKYQNMR